MSGKGRRVCLIGQDNVRFYPKQDVLYVFYKVQDVHPLWTLYVKHILFYVASSLKILFIFSKITPITPKSAEFLQTFTKKKSSSRFKYMSSNFVS
ncbi:hypothetical protein BpHYR1_035309 [Brachionus plicatilis]|uniref:Uncharacterized protein n=1 Tax=Brachionus plicatilis TaxID=10195 RepID=A0A3M7QPH9_BRAPC|nr:hypothetical protein BpHYR1_035309 [Brachionus plicatilis]